MSFARVSAFLKNIPGFIHTADVYRLPKASRYVKFLKLFGYEIQGSGPGMIVKRPSTASSSRGRPEGSIDIAERTPRATYPAAQKINLTPNNPHRLGTGAYNRYEAYKSATNIGELRQRGATPQDIREILQKGYGQLE